MSSSPTAPTSTTGSSTSSPSRADGAVPRVALVACGALAQPAAPVVARRGWPVDVHPLPPLLHNQPQLIAGEVARAGRPSCAASYDRRRGGLRRLRHLRRARRGLRRARAAPAARAALLRRVRRRRAGSSGSSTTQPGTYLLTDFLVRSFARTVVRELGPRPLAGAARRLLRPLHAGGLAGPGARRRSCARWPRTPPPGIGLPLTVVETGDRGLERALAALLPDRRAAPPTPQPAIGRTTPSVDRSRSSSSVRQASVSAIWLKVKTCSPSTQASRAAPAAGAHFSRKRSPVKPPGAASRANVPLCLARNRVDSPTPILVAIAEQLGAVDRARACRAAAAS